MSTESILRTVIAAATAQRERKQRASIPYSFFCPQCLHQQFFNLTTSAAALNTTDAVNVAI